MKKYLFIASIAFYGCQVTENVSKVTTIDFNDAYNNKDEVAISEICNHIDYIPLETTNESMVGDIKDMKVFKNYIIILDNTKRLFVFDKKGKFISILDHEGRGPNEYIEIADFSFNEKENSIAIFSTLGDNKVLLFSPKGKFVDSFKVSNEVEKVYEFSNNFLFYNSHYFRSQSNSNSLSVFSTKGELKTELLEKNREKTIPFFNQYDLKTSIFKLNDKMILWEKGFDNELDTIWNINKDFEASPRYVLNIGGEKFPIERYTDKETISFEERMKKTEIQGYLESERYIFCSITHAKRVTRFIYDKKTAIIKRVYNQKGDRKFIVMLENDLDYLSPFWPEAIFSDNKMYKLVYGYELKNFVAKMDSNDKKDNNQIKIIENSQITDNPMLMVVTLNK
ncbi:6-bladed beta-propeller [Flavobacterium limnophilum]|uniref:6-bladed beta-propeller n=1 Tax=Flavobacterium limnophilum TaxID=3003262 RepID=UPI0022AC622A|nr:6-bladed beta-propeller [Flavobacterium limnophilum]